MQSIPIRDALFTKTQQKVLGLLYGRPQESFYMNEIMRLAGVGRGTIKRELERMVAAGLLTVTPIGNQNHYQANQSSPIFEQLYDIVLKTFGAVTVPQDALLALVQRYHIKRLVLFGSAARGELGPDSDIDLLVEFKAGRAPSLGGMVAINAAFSTLFDGRKVDLATPSILNNPYRRRAIERDMEELYAA